MPVCTVWVLSDSAVSISLACASSFGLPIITPSSSTTVSAPITMESGYCCATACALTTESTAACARGTLI